MYFQQELWLVIVGLVTTFIVQRTSPSNTLFFKVAPWACGFSVAMGEFGMLSTLFFPSDLLGLILTTFAAMMGIWFATKRLNRSPKTPRATRAKRSNNASRTSKPNSPTPSK